MRKRVHLSKTARKIRKRRHLTTPASMELMESRILLDAQNLPLPTFDAPDNAPAILAQADLSAGEGVGDQVGSTMTITRSASFYDDAGNAVTISVRGAQAQVTTSEPDGGRILGIEILDSTTRSSLTITSRAGTTVEGITVRGSIGTINASGATLAGDLIVEGSLTSLKLNDVQADSRIQVHTDAELEIDSRYSLTVRCGDVANATLDAGDMPVRSITADSWLGGSITGTTLGTITLRGDLNATITATATDSRSYSIKRISAKNATGTVINANGGAGTLSTTRWDNGSINAGWIQSLKVNDRYSEGTFTTDITLTGNALPANRRILSSARVYSAVDGATWTLPGAVGPITVADATNLTVTGFTAVSSVRLGQASGVQLVGTGTLGRITATDWTGGAITADAVSGITSRGDLTEVTLTAATVGTVSAAGDVSGDWDGDSLRGLTVRGNLDADMDYDTSGAVNVYGDMTGQWTGQSVRSITVRGSLDEATISIDESGAVSIYGDAEVDWTGESMRSLTVRGSLIGDDDPADADIDVTTLGTVTIYGDLTAGIQSDTMKGLTVRGGLLDGDFQIGESGRVTVYGDWDVTWTGLIMGNLTVRGDMTDAQPGTDLQVGQIGTINIYGVMNADIESQTARGLTVRGNLTDADIAIDEIGSITIYGNMTADWTGQKATSLTVRGAMAGSTITLSAPAEYRQYTLRTLSVTETIADSTIRVAGHLSSAKAGAMENSALLVGLDQAYAADTDGDGVIDLPLNTDPYVTGVDGEVATLGRLTVSGSRTLKTDLYVNTNVAAANVGTVSLKEVTTDNGEAFGIASGDTFRSVSMRQGRTSRSWRAGQRPLDDDDFFMIAPGLNNAPHSVNDTAVTIEDGAGVVFNVLDNDTDINGDALSIAGFDQPEHGTVTDMPNGQFVYTPDPDFNGTDSFTYTVSDGRDAENTGLVVITVAAVNDAPVAGDNEATVNEDATVTIANLLDNDTDVDGDALTLHSVVQPAHGTVIDNGDGTFGYTPDADFFGADSFTYTVTDGNGGTDTATVTITVIAVNDLPVVTDDSAAGNEDSPIAIANVFANDSDAEGPVTLFANDARGQHGAVEYLGNGAFTYTPDANWFGTDTFNYIVADTDGALVSGTVTVTVANVNDNPTAGDDSLITAENTAGTTANVLANDTDIEGDTVSYDSHTNGAHGTVAYNDDGTFTYTPDANFYGDDSFTYTVTDGNGGTDTATVAVTVTHVNQAPDANDDAAAGLEDNDIVIADVLANDTDAEGSELTIDSFTQASHGTVVDNGDGSFTYTPEAEYSGSDSFTYTISDTNGATAEATVTITVNAVNDAPDARADADFTNVNTPKTTINVLENDTDVDGGDLAITNFTQPAHGGVVYNGDGTFTYTPTDYFVGNDTFTYTVNDGSGGTDTATVTMTRPRITLDDLGAPTLNGVEAEGWHTYRIRATAGEGEDLFHYFTVNYADNLHQVWGHGNTVTANADQIGFDADWEDFDTYFLITTAQTADSMGISETNNGSNPTELNFSADGNDGKAGMGSFEAMPISYNTEDIPGQSYQFFQFVIRDSDAVTISGQASQGNDQTYDWSFTILGDGSNGAPIALNDDVAVDVNTATLTHDVLANDNDIDGDMLSITAHTQGAHGTVAYNDNGTFTYTPDADYTGADSFTYTLSDSKGATDIGTVNLTVSIPNDPPVTATDEFTRYLNDDFTTTNVLINDTDPDGHDFSITDFTQPAHGRVVYNDDGTFTYTQTDYFAGNDLFTYTVTDELGGTSTGTVVINRPKITLDDLGAPDLDGQTLDGWHVYQLRATAADGEAWFDVFGIDEVQGVHQVWSQIGTTPDANLYLMPEDWHDLDTHVMFTDDVLDGFTHGDAETNDGTNPLDGTFTDGVLIGTAGMGSFEFTLVSLDTNNLPGQSVPFFQVVIPDGARITVSGYASNGSGDYFSITVGEGGNAYPIAVDDSINAAANNATVTPNLLSNDTDEDDDALSISNFTQPAHGSLVYNDDGTFTYTPDNNHSGADSFTYTVSDGNGGTDVATVNITVAPNNQPNAGDDNFTAVFNGVYTTDSVLGNDTDGDGQSLNVISFTQATHGAVSHLGNGIFTYTLNDYFAGDDTFTYTVSDGAGGTDTATVTITKPIVTVDDLGAPTLKGEAAEELHTYRLRFTAPDGEAALDLFTINEIANVHNVYSLVNRPTTNATDASDAYLFDADWEDFDTHSMTTDDMEDFPLGSTETNDGSNPTGLDFGDGTAGYGTFSATGFSIGYDRLPPTSWQFFQVVLPVGPSVTISGQVSNREQGLFDFSVTI